MHGGAAVALLLLASSVAASDAELRLGSCTLANDGEASYLSSNCSLSGPVGARMARSLHNVATSAVLDLPRSKRSHATLPQAVAASYFDASFTVEVMYRAMALHTHNTAIVSNYGATAPAGDGGLFGLHMFGGDEGDNTPGKIHLTARPAGQSSGDASVDSATPFNDGKWHHIAAVMDFEKNRKHLYIDGIEAGSATLVSGASAPISGESFANPQDLVVGGNHLNRYHDAALASLRIWSMARTAEQVSMDRLDPEGMEEGVVVLHRFADVADASGNGYDLTLHGGATVGSALARSMRLADALSNRMVPIALGTVLNCPRSGNSYATLPQAVPALYFGASFTVDLMYRVTALHTHNTAIVSNYGQTAPASDTGLFILHVMGTAESTPGGVHFSTRPAGPSSSSASTNTDGKAFNDGKWHHLAAVMDFEANARTLYIDGVKMGSGELVSGASAPISGESFANPQDLVVGGNHLNRYHDAALASLRIWSMARTAEQVSMDRLDPEGMEEGVVVLHRFADVADASGNGYDLTLHGDTHFS